MKLLSCLLLLLLCALFTEAQQNFQTARVVLTNNDTLRGQIDFRDWNITPGNIIFRDQRTGNPVSYTPDLLKSFYVNGETYEGLKVKVYPYTLNAVLITDGKFDPTPAEKTLFMRLVSKGKMNLYFYKDSLSTDYFFIQKDGGVTEQLRIKAQFIESDSRLPDTEYGHSGVAFDYLYRDQLLALMADCDKSPSNFTRLAYKEQALKKLVFAYNNCGKDTLDLSDRQKSRPRLEFSLIAGFISSRVNYTSTSFYGTPMKFPSCSSGVFGASVTVPLPRNRQKFAFYLDAMYDHFHSRSNSVSITDVISDTRQFDFSAVKSDLLFRYRWPEGKFRPFFSGGMSFAAIMNNSSRLETYDQVGNSSMTGPIFGEDGFRKIQFGFVAGAGVRTGHLSLEGRFEAGQSLAITISDNAPTISLLLLASFSF